MSEIVNQTIKNLYQPIFRFVKDAPKIKLIKNSIYLTLSKKSANAAIECLTVNGISIDNIDNSTFNYLDQNNYIFEFVDKNDSKKKITLNAHGIFHWEKKRKIINVEDIIDVVNTDWLKKIPKKENNGLSTKERLVLLVLLSMRSFDVNHCINANKDQKYNFKAWLKIFRDCDSFIVSSNLGKHYESLDSETMGNQETVFAIVSRIENLPSKTNLIYQQIKKNCYCLDIKNDLGEIDKRKISHLMMLICGEQTNSFTDLLKFLEEYYKDNWSKVYDNPLYNDPSIVEILTEATIEALGDELR